MARTDVGATYLVHRQSRGAPPAAGSSLGPIVFNHGYNATRYQAQQGWSFGDHPNRLADEGFTIVAADNTVGGGGATSLPCPAVSTNLDAAVDYALSLTGAAKCALCGWSGGGGDSIAYVLSSPARAAKISRIGLFNPLTDLDWAAALAGYVPAYSTVGVTPSPGWKTGLDAAYSPSYAAGVTAPYRLHDQGPAFAALGIPTVMWVAQSDTTLPPPAAAAFVAAANAPHVTLRPTVGGHGNLPSVPTTESVSFFRGDG